MTAAQILALVKLGLLLAVLAGVGYVGKLFVDGRKAVDSLKEANQQISDLKGAAEKALADHNAEKLRLVTEGREAVAAVSKDAIQRFSELAKNDATVARKVKDIYELAKTGDCFFGPLPSGVLDIMQGTVDEAGNRVRSGGTAAAPARIPVGRARTPDGG